MNSIEDALAALEKLTAKVEVLVKVNEHLFAISNVFVGDLARIAQGMHAPDCSCQKAAWTGTKVNGCTKLATNALVAAAGAQSKILAASQEEARGAL